MTTPKRLFLIIVTVTIFVFAGATWLRVMTQEAPSVHPVTILYQRTSFSDKTTFQPTFAQTQILGIRADGSVARAVFQPHVRDHAAFYERAVTDVAHGRHILVDPFTESTTTYPSADIVQRIRWKPANSCPGQRDEKVLGYETFSEVKTLAHKAPGGSTTVTTWRAPELDCAMLRQESKMAKANGRVLFQTIAATLVTRGDPPAWLFEIPRDYTERSPSAVDSEAAVRLGSNVPARRSLEEAYNEANRQK